ncbi:hypothetical protein Tco_0911373 [Tanacetum coccineum]|uniref:Uncharacterized protein n=1 Tax=Tanacetum coccineum TaxID=301880 RepID=A0ABQ5CXS7_9ASTR
MLRVSPPLAFLYGEIEEEVYSLNLKALKILTSQSMCIEWLKLCMDFIKHLEPGMQDCLLFCYNTITEECEDLEVVDERKFEKSAIGENEILLRVYKRNSCLMENHPVDDPFPGRRLNFMAVQEADYYGYYFNQQKPMEMYYDSAVGLLFLLAEYIHAAGVVYAINTSIYAVELASAQFVLLWGWSSALVHLVSAG